LLSFWKLLLLVIVIGGIWAGVTIYKRSQRQRELSERAGAKAKPEVGHVQMVACRACGTYVPAQGATRCARADCPV
jgi:hypothetical protein